MKDKQSTTVKAYRVDVSDWPEATAIVKTHSAKRAKYLCWKSAKEAGYKVPFGRFSVNRSPNHDSGKYMKQDHCYSLEYADKPNNDETI